MRREKRGSYKSQISPARVAITNHLANLRKFLGGVTRTAAYKEPTFTPFGNVSIKSGNSISLKLSFIHSAMKNEIQFILFLFALVQASVSNHRNVVSPNGCNLPKFCLGWLQRWR